MQTNTTTNSVAKKIISKRKRLWEARKDRAYDEKYVQAVANEICQNAELRHEIHTKPYLLIEMCFSIVDKQGKTVPFFLNEVQAEFVSTLEKLGTSKPYYILKGRQQGFTTLITAIQLSYALTTRNFSGMTIADCTENTRVIFQDKAKTVYNRLPTALKPTEKYNSANELYFEKLNASWRVATATSNVGRSRTLRFLHLSEIAFYEVPFSDIQAGLGQAVVKDAFVVYETTANGYNDAKALWDSNSCNNLFFAWWQTAEYYKDDVSVIDDVTDAWLVERIQLLRNKGLTDNQIAWYVDKYNSYTDKQLIRQEYPCSADEAFIASGSSIFGDEEVLRRLDGANDAEYVCDFEYSRRYLDDNTVVLSDVELVEKAAGAIKIYQLPKNGHYYTIGGDTAGDGSDHFIAQVIDVQTLEQCAVFDRESIDEDEYSEIVYLLAQLYNHALIAIEVNFSTYPTRYITERLQYSNVYLRQEFDSIAQKYSARYGFKTTAITRPNIISDLVVIFRENANLIKDKTTLREMLVFVKDKKGKPQAIDGYHDDNVMALAIAYWARQQQRIETTPQQSNELQLPWQLQDENKQNKKSWGDY